MTSQIKFQRKQNACQKSESKQTCFKGSDHGIISYRIKISTYKVCEE